MGFDAGHNLTSSEDTNIDIGNGGVTGDSYIIRIGDVRRQHSSRELLA